MVSGPTRSTISTDTLIDLAYLSDPSMLTSCTIEPPLDGSDHNLLCLDLCLSPPRQKKVGRRVWLYKQADFESTNNLLLSTPSNIIQDNDVDNFWGFVSLNSRVCVLAFSSKSAMGHLHTLHTFGGL